MSYITYEGFNRAQCNYSTLCFPAGLQVFQGGMYVALSSTQRSTSSLSKAKRTRRGGQVAIFHLD